MDILFWLAAGITLILAIREVAKKPSHTPRSYPSRPPINAQTKRAPRQPADRSARVLDTIQFRYMDRNGVTSERTVEVYTGKRGDYFRGHCRLRNNERQFFFHRILDGEVIRVETGELLAVDDWRAYLKSVKRPGKAFL